MLSASLLNVADCTSLIDFLPERQTVHLRVIRYDETIERAIGVKANGGQSISELLHYPFIILS